MIWKNTREVFLQIEEHLPSALDLGLRLRKSENLQFPAGARIWDGREDRPPAPPPEAQLEMLRSVRIQVKLARREDAGMYSSKPRAFAGVLLGLEKLVPKCSYEWR